MILRRYAAVVLLLIFIASPSTLLAQQTPAPAPDPNDPIQRIKDEGMNRSQVMQTLSYLSDVIGPRLTASPGMKRANEWTRDQLTKWGLQNAHLESWGPFGRGWTLKRFSAQVTEPTAIPLIAYPKAWSPGLTRPLTADVVYFDARTEADFEKFKGKLNGKIVLTAPIREVSAHFDAPGTRLNEKDLLALADVRGYANAPVIAQRGDDRSAEFYAYGRVLYRANGDVITFDEISVEEAKARGRKFVVFIPVKYVENYRGASRIEVIGDNGRTAVLGWQP